MYVCIFHGGIRGISWFASDTGRYTAGSTTVALRTIDVVLVLFAYVFSSTGTFFSLFLACFVTTGQISRKFAIIIILAPSQAAAGYFANGLDLPSAAEWE